MKISLFLAVLIASVVSPSARAQSADALGAGYAGAATAAADAAKSQRALAARADAAARAATAAEGAELKKFDLASNDSNSPDIYRALVAAGAHKTCTHERADDGGFPRDRETCDATGSLAKITVFRNEIIWQSTELVDVQGPVHCWQEWIAQGGVHRRPASLWYFCSFRGVVEAAR